MVRSVSKTSKSPKTSRRTPVPLTPEGQESYMISLATDVAREQLENRTASSAVIVHYLKLGTEKARLEMELLEKQKMLADAKTESYQSNKKIEEIMQNALEAMKSYSMSGGDDEY